MTDRDLARWKVAWRYGIAPDEQISIFSLIQLREALEGNDCRLVQGEITVPDRVERATYTGYTRDPVCVGACPVAYMLWVGMGLSRCREVEHHFRKLTKRVNTRLYQLEIKPVPYFGHFANWWDNLNLDTARRYLLLEVESEIKRRDRCG